MKELKPCPMKTSEIIKGLRACEIEADCTVCSLKNYDQNNCEEYLATQAINRLEELNRRAEPENKPLSLEQLRQMNGKPIWVVPLTPMIDEFKPHWCIMKSTASAMSETKKGRMWFLHLCDYGKTWLAYAREPEGSEK